MITTSELKTFTAKHLETATTQDTKLSTAAPVLQLIISKETPTLSLVSFVVFLPPSTSLLCLTWPHVVSDQKTIFLDQPLFVSSLSMSFSLPFLVSMFWGWWANLSCWWQLKQLLIGNLHAKWIHRGRLPVNIVTPETVTPVSLALVLLPILPQSPPTFPKGSTLIIKSNISSSLCSKASVIQFKNGNSLELQAAS